MHIFSPKKWRDDGPVWKKRENGTHGINKGKSKWKKRLTTLFLAGLLFLFVGGTAGAGYYAWLMRYLPSPDRMIDRQLKQATKIYDREEKTLLYEVYGDQNRTMISLEEMSPYVKWATLSAEDRNFYNHHGISWKGIARSILSNVFKGTKVSGSTITQQFVKNAVLTPEKTYIRKFKEIILTVQLENKFSKDEILKMYLNEIPYGSVTYGIGSASRRFFGKTAKDLNIAEAAFLASIPQAPTFYSPYGQNRDALTARYKYVIDAMAEQNYITKEEAESAKKENLFGKLQDNRVYITAPHFVFYVKDFLSDMFGERLVEEGGLKVITSLDIEKQKLAEKIITDNRKNINSYNAKNAALIAVDNKTGEVLSMVGSVDYFDKTIDGNVNVALRPRQPGSSFKPIAYAAAFSRGYTPNMILEDVETTFPTQAEKDGYAPKNYDGKEHGLVSAKQALAGSLNIPAVKMVYLAGVSNVLDLADSLGYTTLKDRSRFGLSLVLGGGEVKLAEHAQAFTTFANDGSMAELAPILKVLDSSGRVLYEHKPNLKKVLDEEVARQINDILSDNSAREYIFGANNYLNLGFPSAVKTGTTNDNHDAWTIGYTPEIAVGVWVGNNDNKAMKEKADGSVVAAPIWNAFMKAAVKDKTLQFSKPKPVITGKPILDGEQLPGSMVKIDKASGKIATDFTPPAFIINKIYKEVHSILYYVDKDNPQGPPPADPAKDPFYAAWEGALQTWAAKQGIIGELPPTGYDDLHIPANKPEITIISPQNNASLGKIFSTAVKTSAPRGVSRVEYYLDGKLVATSAQSPFYGNISLSADVGKGFHMFKAIAYDDIDNSNFHEIYINITSGVSMSDISWISPKNNSIISAFPINISFNLSGVTGVSFWYTKAGENNYYKIGEAQNPAGYSSVVWSGENVGGGNYEIKAIIQDTSGNKERNISVTVQ